jgi:hypothetical protein
MIMTDVIEMLAADRSIGIRMNKKEHGKNTANYCFEWKDEVIKKTNFVSVATAIQHYSGTRLTFCDVRINANTLRGWLILYLCDMITRDIERNVEENQLVMVDYNGELGPITFSQVQVGFSSFDVMHQTSENV